MFQMLNRFTLIVVALVALHARAQEALVDPSTLKQFDDNRVFVVNGRKCVGSELNGQRNEDKDERKFTSGNRVINPHPVRVEHPLEWELKPDAELFDGAGVLMGTSPARTKLDAGRRAPVSKFNYGMSKTIAGRQ